MLKKLVRMVKYSGASRKNSAYTASIANCNYTPAKYMLAII